MNKRLGLFLCGVAFSFAASGAAFAADVALKAPPSAPAPVYNWTGWYAGVNLGASFGNVKTDFNDPVTVTTSVVQGVNTGSGSFTFPFSGSNRLYPSGFMGGGQVGYNWQYSPLIVVGLEADFQGTDEKERSGTFTNNFSSGLNGAANEFFVNVFTPTGALAFTLPVTAVGSSVLAYQTKIDWFGTVRGRIGYLWGDGTVLTYVTGGLAYGRVGLDGTNTVTAAQSSTPFLLSVTQAFGHSQVNTGWVVGFGTEGKLLIPGWTYKIESLYMDLGTLDTASSVSATSASFTIPGTNIVTANSLTGAVSTHTHFTDGILRAGLNYQFH
jgi:outer membrane immunogenic protein